MREVALARLDEGVEGADKAFYEGKVAGAQFFARNMLPLLTSVKAVLANLDNDIMELDISPSAGERGRFSATTPVNLASRLRATVWEWRGPAPFTG